MAVRRMAASDEIAEPFWTRGQTEQVPIRWVLCIRFHPTENPSCRSAHDSAALSYFSEESGAGLGAAGTNARTTSTELVGFGIAAYHFRAIGNVQKYRALQTPKEASQGAPTDSFQVGA